MHWYFFFFFISGFCSLVYQVTWLRVAMAAFGVTTSLVAVVLSVFMAGLALGSWGGGVLVGRLRGGSARNFLLLYGAAEALIGLSGFIVAPLMGYGKELLLHSGMTAWGGSGYFAVSGCIIMVALLPFCTCMGATFPLAMAAVRGAHGDSSGTSFSYLYLANLFGAMAGGLCSAFVLIELLGFRHTMLAAAGLNLLVACLATVVSRGSAYGVPLSGGGGLRTEAAEPGPRDPRTMVLLFMTGLVSLAMEVVWTRQYIPYLGPVVYTFAAILAIYLGTNLAGAHIYRSWFRGHPLVSGGQGVTALTVLAAAAALIPLVVTDFLLPLGNGLVTGLVRVLAGIGPFCLLLGFLTPALIDRLSEGHPGRAGVAYACNTVGCIAGPLLAGFLLLPRFGERWSLTLLALPLFLCALLFRGNRSGESGGGMDVRTFRTGIGAILVISCLVVAFSRDYEHKFPGGKVFRDHTATVIVAGEGMNTLLMVNGVGVTKLTPITKMMVHLPLAFRETPPRNGLTLCLGMGTSFRSMLTWGIATTAVELVPSVPPLLPIFHADGRELLAGQGGRIVVDDARRFLERSREEFDVIVIDPPPPVEAAASSLLHSREFYGAVARRLAPGGVLQQWIPWLADGFVDTELLVSMTRALTESFPHVRAFRSYEGWGFHVIASMTPIPDMTPSRLAAHLPPRAAADLVEWGPRDTPRDQFASVLAQEVAVQDILDMAPGAPVLTDDRPANEYFLLRRAFGRRGE